MSKRVGMGMKEVELKLISELLKNSRRSDRDLANQSEHLSLQSLELEADWKLKATLRSIL